MDSSLSSDDNDKYYHEVYTKLKNENWQELSLSTDNFPYRLIHSVRVSPEESPYYGVIVVLESPDGKNVVLDGNHRVNTLKEMQDPTEFPVLLISGFLP